MKPVKTIHDSIKINLKNNGNTFSTQLNGLKPCYYETYRICFKLNQQSYCFIYFNSSEKKIMNTLVITFSALYFSIQLYFKSALKTSLQHKKNQTQFKLNHGIIIKVTCLFEPLIVSFL